MPANDGTSRGWFAILTPRGQDIEVSIRALHFDAKEAAAAIYAQPAQLNITAAEAVDREFTYRAKFWKIHILN